MFITTYYFMQIYFILFCKLNVDFTLDGKVQGNFSCFITCFRVSVLENS